MGWPTRAAAIVCVPCRRQGGHFLPTSELVLASLDGTEQRHPVFQLAALTRSPRTVSELRRRGVEEIVVVVDDLAVPRSWMLPSAAATVADLWPDLCASFTRVLEGGPIPCRVTLWSRLVEGLDYEGEVGRVAVLCEGSATPEKDPLHTAFGTEIAKRRRFERETGRGDTAEVMRRRAAAQVANYAAQGKLLHAWGLNTYLAWTVEETGLMAVVEPGFTDLVLKATYGSLQQNQEEPWGAFPVDFSELREELRLYADDLERTPGRVRPELATTLLNALAQLLTPGTQSAAARQVRAFNHVLSGGQANRLRTERLLEEALRLPLIPGWAVEQTVKKLFCQLASRYGDDEADAEYTRHVDVVRSLSRRLPAHRREHVALALTGSLALAPAGIWHPFFSDIDVMPLFSTPPPEGLVAAVRASYTSTPRPPWLYLNEGAKQGLAGLTHDPTRGMFVADRLHTLTDTEYGKLSRLVAPMRHVGGSPAVFTTFTDAYHRQRHARSEQPREGAGAD
ncbi:hypothetical protein [Nocardiopsis sp. FR4]|uniref:hypothetical protein n=1 Tax=Nocardiopsis sp. FR4 TaxID=2605985 RepID=UPI00135C230E|nr:hypothetical protein [Nocardiopsis sp. FR4]